MNDLIVSAKDSMLESVKNTTIGFFKWIALGLIDNSYGICLFVCMMALLLYIAGQRKAGKYVTISFVIYFVAQAMKGLVK